MKEDIIRSLQARLELLSDELRQSSTEEEVKEVDTGKKVTKTDCISEYLLTHCDTQCSIVTEWPAS